MIEYQNTILQVQNLCGGDYIINLSDKEKGYTIFSFPIKLEKDNATFDEVIFAFNVIAGKAMYEATKGKWNCKNSCSQ